MGHVFQGYDVFKMLFEVKKKATQARQDCLEFVDKRIQGSAISWVFVSMLVCIKLPLFLFGLAKARLRLSQSDH